MIAALSDLNIMTCNIQKAYLTADCRELREWNIAGPEFESEVGKNILVKGELYGLKSPGAAFRAHQA
jgi:hypothetical protein